MQRPQILMCLLISGTPSILAAQERSVTTDAFGSAVAAQVYALYCSSERAHRKHAADIISEGLWLIARCQVITKSRGLTTISHGYVGSGVVAFT
jgi:hypothetical protein